MYARLLPICILATSVYISIGTPDYVESTDSDEKYKYDENEGVYDDTAPNDNGSAQPDVDNNDPYDYEGSGSVEANTDPGSGKEGGDAAQDNAKKAGNDDHHTHTAPAYKNESALDDAGVNGEAGAYDHAGQKYDEADDCDESEYDYDSDSKYSEYEDNGREVDNLKLKMPGSAEMRNMPELGFDLSYDEIMKLKMWPDALIPYYIDVYSFNDKVMRDKIRSFLNSVNSLTALNFVELPSPPSNNMRWVFFVNRRGLLGCADHSIRNFTNTGVQQVVLGYHCMSTEGELAEAVLAIAGVPAQHNAPDRGHYILIKEKNIIPEKKYLFEKLMDDEWLFHDLGYDFNSAGHFHRFKHSVNGWATIETQNKNNAVTIGESKVLTASDILKIRMLYNFIAKKKLLQASDCHKLFEPGNKFKPYKPNSNQLKARPKPVRYTGASRDPLDKDDVEVSAQTQYNEDENIDDVNVELPNIKPNDMKPDTENYNNDRYEKFHDNDPNDGLDEEVSNHVEYFGDDDHIDANEYDQPPIHHHNSGGTDNENVPYEKEEYVNFTPSEFSGKTPTIVQLRPKPMKPNKPLQLVNDHNAPIQQLKLHNSRNKNKPDLLNALSDFQTDEEDKRQDKKKGLHPKPSAAKYAPHQKIELKFIPYPG